MIVAIEWLDCWIIVANKSWLYIKDIATEKLWLSSFNTKSLQRCQWFQIPFGDTFVRRAVMIEVQTYHSNVRTCMCVYLYVLACSRIYVMSSYGFHLCANSQYSNKEKSGTDGKKEDE